MPQMTGTKKEPLFGLVVKGIYSWTLLQTTYRKKAHCLTSFPKKKVVFVIDRSPETYLEKIVLPVIIAIYKPFQIRKRGTTPLSVKEDIEDVSSELD
ncbi:hypothetical protein TNCV_4400411 [Trichonephila clavipes]|nr:hypothetical protein TNCV_4400411 [Trichonephila clavipes]